MTDLTTRLQKIQGQIAIAAGQAHRPIEEITLIAVSKRQSLADIERLYQLGIRHFGENYLQEALEKIKKLSFSDIQWHFIGHVQTNKTRFIAESFTWCHTLDQLKTAQRLNEQRPTALGPLQVCIQVNIDHDAAKSGIKPEALKTLALGIQQLPHLELRGLMCIPIANSSPQQAQDSFHRLSLLLQELRENPEIKHPEQLDTLSMGMSADLALAIAEGATFVRIGTALFGERQLGEKQ